MKDEPEEIRDGLPLYHDGKFGFVIYRCTYGDDEDWQRFLEKMTRYVQYGINYYEQSADMMDHFTWDVFENEQELGGASKSEVRRQFKDWVASVRGRKSLSRYRACIYADKEVVGAVLAGEDPEDGYVHEPAWIVLIDGKFDEELVQWTSEQVPDDETREMMNRGDEGYEPIEGCRLHDVGWTKVPARHLIPRFYCLLKRGWDLIYARPPEMPSA